MPTTIITTSMANPIFMEGNTHEENDVDPFNMDFREEEPDHFYQVCII